MYERVIKSILLSVLVLASSYVFADAPIDDSTSARVELITAILTAIKITGFMIGLGVLIVSLYKMKLIGESGHKNGISVVYIGVLTSMFMMNTDAWFSVFTSTFFDSDEICYVIAQNKIDENCFRDEMSGVTGDLKERIKKQSSESAATAFVDNVKVIIGMFQIIGFTYFLVGANGLVQVANGSSRDGGYGKPIITMIAAALIVDIPHTAQMAINTLEQIGVNF
ncbi:hypothetical protein [Pseudomonas sp. DG56-2]|uniref:hypothetical protein n=1 Tax=Pseudomonas sp. DG56-2 TaxID=2320270 RepID=UPI0010A67AAC|nr:hypothetical protein [Pseudomonas sp. DG56-2]